MTVAPQAVSAFDRVVPAILATTRETPRTIKDGDAVIRCPAHPDGRPSLHVTQVPGKVLLKCFAGCSEPDICAAAGLRRSDLFDDPPKAKGSARGDVLGTWRYVDEDGRPLFEVVKREGKRFTQRAPKAGGGYAYRLAGVRRVLYRLPELLEAVAQGVPVWIAEGEKDADALVRAGVVATCNPGGACKWRAEYSPTLAGAHVTIAADRDGPGAKHALQVAEALEGVAASVRIVRAAHGKDAADHLAAGLALEAFEPVTAAELLAELGQVDDGPARSSGPLRVITGGGGGGGGDEDAGGVFYPQGAPGYSYAPGVGVWKDGAQVWRWCPTVEEALVAERDRFYALELEGKADVVSHDELNKGDAWKLFPGAVGVATRAHFATLAAIVQDQAGRLEAVAVVDRTGWHDHAGALAYVGPDGRTWPEGAALRLYGMPEQTALSAAEEPDTMPDDAAIAGALETLFAAGGDKCAQAIALGAGARSLGYSFAPASTSLVLEGRAGSGKTSSAGAARWLTMGPEWPPTQSAAFADTPLAIELAVNREADMPVLIDDLALQLDASETEKREANKKLEHIIRPAGNNTSMRRRGTRDLLEAQSNRVRSVCILTAENLPPAIGESLLRRCLVVTIARGDVDTDAMRNGTPELWPAVRTLGGRIVARLGELGREDAGAQLRAADDRWTMAIGHALDTRHPSANGATLDLARWAAPMLTGLELAALALGLEPEHYAGRVVGAVADHLAAQGDRMTARNETASDAGEAAGDVLRTALIRGHAHVLHGDGRPAFDAVPGMAPQELGYRPDPQGGWAPQGVPVYWLPDNGPAVGVKATTLHALGQRVGERRFDGITRRTLPRALGRAGAIIPSTQKEGAHTWQVKIAGANVRLILLPFELLTGEHGPEGSGPDTGPGGGPPTPQDADAGRTLEELSREYAALPPEPFAAVSARLEALPDNATDAEQRATLAAALEELAQAGKDDAAPAAEPSSGEEPGPVAEELAPVAQAPEAQPAAQAAAGRRPSSSRAARPNTGPVPYVTMTTDGARLYAAGGATAELGPIAHAGELLEAARALAPGRRIALHVHERGARAWKFPATPPAPTKAGAHRPVPFIGRAVKAGANVKRQGGAWIVDPQADAEAVIYLPGYSGDFAGLADAAELLDALERFGAALGDFAFAFSGASTVHNLVKRTNGRKIEPPTPAPDVIGAEYVTTQWATPANEWHRAPTAAEAAAAYVRVFDRSASYLTALDGARLPDGAWLELGAHVLELEPEAKRPAGYWLADVGRLVEALGPYAVNPFGRHALAPEAGPVWITTPLVHLAAELAEELGVGVNVSRAIVAERAGRFLDPAARVLKAARAELGEDDTPAARAALSVLKAGYAGAVAWFEYGPKPPAPLARPAWRHTITDRHAANTFRALRHARPLAFTGVDAAAFALEGPDAAPAGLDRIGTTPGAWKRKGRAVPMGEALAALEAGGPAALVTLAESAEDEGADNGNS